jgi:hypothetical protein
MNHSRNGFQLTSWRKRFALIPFCTYLGVGVTSRGNGFTGSHLIQSATRWPMSPAAGSLGVGLPPQELAAVSGCHVASRNPVHVRMAFALLAAPTAENSVRHLIDPIRLGRGRGILCRPTTMLLSVPQRKRQDDLWRDHPCLHPLDGRFASKLSVTKQKHRSRGDAASALAFPCISLP